jgi:hypothetical protein
MARNGVHDGSNAYEGMRQFLHRHGATPAELERAIVAAERSQNLAELGVIITKRPDAETLRIAQTYAQELASNKGLRTRFDRVQTAIQSAIGKDAGHITPEKVEELRKAREELANIERQLSQRGVVSGGIHYTPEASRAGENRTLLGDGIHGIDWPDAEVKERIRATGIAQGRFGSVGDVTYAVQQGPAVGRGNFRNIPVPPGNTSRIYTLDAQGRLIAQNPNSYFIKVYPDGRVHAYPSLDLPTR